MPPFVINIITKKAKLRPRPLTSCELLVSKLARPVQDLNNLVSSAQNMDLREFVQLTEDVIDTLSKEDERVGSLKITGRLVEVPPKGSAIIVGDLHGDLDSLSHIMKDSHFLENAQHNEPLLLIFLGDYGDRGMRSPEVYYIVLRLKLKFPSNVILMRGNHEGPDDLMASPHDLPMDLHSRFGKDWADAYSRLMRLFGYLYTVVVIKERCVLVHGGVPSGAASLDDLAFAHWKHPSENHLEEILWSDPEEGITGTYPSPRGAGYLFGVDVTSRFLEMLNVKALIRGHEPCDQGYKINHNGRILTLFSRKGEPYFNAQAAYLHFDLASEINDATQLQRYVKCF
jgi:protein phosphatase